MVFPDATTSNHVSSRFAVFLIVARADADEDSGNSIEVSFGFDMYYKD